MAREAVIDTTLLYVKRFGREGFATSDDFDGGSESVVALNDTTDLTSGEQTKHHKVVAGVLTVMSAGEKATVDLTVPTVFQNRSQVVFSIRSPNANDDITKGLFVGAAWFDSTASIVSVLRANTPLSADWVDVTASGGGGLAYIQLRHSVSLAVPGSPALIPFDTTAQTSGVPPFTSDNAGTLTAVTSGKVLFRVDMNMTHSGASATARSVLGIYESTGGAYALLPFSPSRNRGTVDLSQQKFGTAVPHDVVSGNTYRAYVHIDAGTGSATGTADQMRWSAYLMEPA